MNNTVFTVEYTIKNLEYNIKILFTVELTITCLHYCIQYRVHNSVKRYFCMNFNSYLYNQIKRYFTQLVISMLCSDVKFKYPAQGGRVELCSDVKCNILHGSVMLCCEVM